MGRADVPGPGVGFLVLVPPGGKLAIADEWPIEPTAGLAFDPGVPGGVLPHLNSSLADYDGIRLTATYLYGPPGRDLHEISTLGIQIADFDGDALGSPVILVLNLPEPATLTLLALGACALLRRRRR